MIELYVKSKRSGLAKKIFNLLSNGESGTSVDTRLGTGETRTAIFGRPNKLQKLAVSICGGRFEQS